VLANSARPHLEAGIGLLWQHRPFEWRVGRSRSATPSADSVAVPRPRVAAAVEWQSVGMVAPCRLSDCHGALRCPAFFPGPKARRPIASPLRSAGWLFVVGLHPV